MDPNDALADSKVYYSTAAGLRRGVSRRVSDALALK